MKKRSAAARLVLDELDAELAANAARAGRTLGWSAADRAVLSMIADGMDRTTELADEYHQADDVKERIKLSRELRLQEASTARLLSRVETTVPEQDSLRTIKARAAARVRWDAPHAN